MTLILVTPTAAPGEYYYLAYQELIPQQILGDPEQNMPGEYNRTYDMDFEREILDKYAELMATSKVPVYVEENDFSITTFTDTWYIAKITMK